MPVVTGRESREEFLTEKTSYYEGVACLNRNLPPDARVLIGHVFVLYVARPTVVSTPDVLESTAGPAETRAFVRRYGLTHAALFTTDVVRRRQVRYLGARLIGRVTVHPIRSRTLAEIGPPETMLVFALGARA